MKTLNETPKKNPYFDDDALSSDRTVDATDAGDEDQDQDSTDIDLQGDDLDIENADEWDEADMEDDLDERDLEDDDQLNAELHQVKNDQFGSIATEIVGSHQVRYSEM
jgi:hypothetical protein